MKLGKEITNKNIKTNVETSKDRSNKHIKMQMLLTKAQSSTTQQVFKYL